MPYAAIVTVLFIAGSNVVQPDPARLQSLVEQLGAKDFRTRESAGKTLLAIGGPKLPTLKALLPTVKDPEAHRRLTAIVEKLRIKSLGLPRRITLHVKDKGIKDIIAELSKQSGYRIEFQSTPIDKHFSLNLDNVPFWKALDRVCDKTTHYTHRPDGYGIISLIPNETCNPHVCYTGPIRIVANSINESRNLQLARRPRRQLIVRQPGSLTLRMTIQAEPKAPIVGIGQPILTKAIDERGTSMLPIPSDNSSKRVNQSAPQVRFRSLAHAFDQRLSHPDRYAETIQELQGKVPVTLLADTRPELIVDNLLTVKKKMFPGLTANLEVIAADYQNNTLDLDVNIHSRQSGQRDDYWLCSMYQHLEVTDANGVPFRLDRIKRQWFGSNFVQGEGVINYIALRLRFRALKAAQGAPHRLQFVEWKTVTREVPFSFKNLPLP